MCGIAGLLKFNAPVAHDDVAAGRRMMDAQVHRGPDGEGLHRDDRVVLGHRRLSIIDLSPAGKQPMSNEACAECRRSNGTVWVTYNGEIYNFRELREELIGRGHAFKSKTDTEVLVHGYEEWGIEGLLSRLRGMFAFALYDPRPGSSPSPLTPYSSRLFLARDRFGIKPLYYYQNRDQLIFASEVRAVMRSGMVPDEKNMEALVRFLQLGSVPVPMTTIKNVFALPAGHYLEANQEGANLKRYWDLSVHLNQSQSVSTQSPISNLESPIKTTRSLLEDSVRHHLISDVPLGVFLSGGIDSSSLVSMASRLLDKPLTTLSVVFDEAAFNEARYARLVAEHYRTDHREILVRRESFARELPKIFGAMDQPTVDGVNTYFVSKAAREAGLTVVLSGIGGDEVFLGYDHFKKADSFDGLRRFFGLLPGGIRKGLIGMAMQAGTRLGKSGMEKLAYLVEPSDENSYLLFRGLFAPRQIQKLLGMSERELSAFIPQPPISNLRPPTSSSLLNSFTLFEFGHYLQNQLLKDADGMGMAHSIEIRVPFLDHRLVEYMTAIPAGAKLNGGINKPILVKALGWRLAKEIWNRPKMGFTFPFGRWIEQQADDLRAGSLEQKVLDPDAVKEVWTNFHEGRAHWSRPWATVVAARFNQPG